VKLIEEIVVEEFLPTLRAMLAADLSERGLTQSEVANALGVSQSAVSKYVHGRIERNDRIASDDRVVALVERIGRGLAAGDLSRAGAVVETEVLIRELETGGGVLARLHEVAVPGLADYEGEFRVHDPGSRVRARERTLASVRRGLSVLENTAGFGALIPNVGANLVECLPDSEGIDDVAGVPGRVFEVKGRPAVPADPEFGVSAHVARVLLAARAAGSEARAALNVVYDPGLLEALEAEGHETAEFDAGGEIEPAVGAAVADRPDATVLYQTGDVGVEPITYLLGPDAPTLADIARGLSRRD